MARGFNVRIRLLFVVLALSGARSIPEAAECTVQIQLEDQTRWCWAGAAQMVRAYYDERVMVDGQNVIYPQCRDAKYAAHQGFLRNVPTTTDCCVSGNASGICNTTCWPQILSTNLCSIRDGVLTWNEITSALPGTSCSPFIFAYTLPGGVTHYRVAVGYGGSSESNGYIHYNDPNPLMQGDTYISYPDFAMNATAVWFDISRNWRPR